MLGLYQSRTVTIRCKGNNVKVPVYSYYTSTGRGPDQKYKTLSHKVVEEIMTLAEAF